MNATAAVVETVHNARAPMPRARGEDEDYTHYQSRIAQGIESTREQALRGFQANAGFGTIGAVVNAVAHPYAIDDRKLAVKAVHITEFRPCLDSLIFKAGKNYLSVIVPTEQPR